MVDLMRRLLMAAVAAGVIAGNMDELERFFDDTVSISRQLATAGDMRSISLMLDHTYLKKGRYPKTEAFRPWMERWFRENNLKPLHTDHWGNDYHYEHQNHRKAYLLVSPGPDRMLGTLDDLTHTGP